MMKTAILAPLRPFLVVVVGRHAPHPDVLDLFVDLCPLGPALPFGDDPVEGLQVLRLGVGQDLLAVVVVVVVGHDDDVRRRRRGAVLADGVRVEHDLGPGRGGQQEERVAVPPELHGLSWAWAAAGDREQGDEASDNEAEHAVKFPKRQWVRS